MTGTALPGEADEAGGPVAVAGAPEVRIGGEQVLVDDAVVGAVGAVAALHVVGEARGRARFSRLE
jgi:hypothetical protein